MCIGICRNIYRILTYWALYRISLVSAAFLEKENKKFNIPSKMLKCKLHVPRWSEAVLILLNSDDSAIKHTSTYLYCLFARAVVI